MTCRVRRCIKLVLEIDPCRDQAVYFIPQIIKSIRIHAGMDDSMAIDMAVKSKELDVKAITTVNGNYPVDKQQSMH